MKHRKLRIAWSVAWGLLAVLLCVLWVRSYWAWDWLSAPGVSFATYAGSLYIELGDREPWGITTTDLLSNTILVVHEETTLGFLVRPSSLYLGMWFLVLMTTSAAALPWMRWSKRFSLRTLLIATTLVAVVL